MQIKTLTITTGEVGMRHQALGLANSLSGDNQDHIVSLPKWLSPLPAHWLPKKFLCLPDIEDRNVLISCGRRSAAFSIALKSQHPELFTVHIQNPQVPLAYFDLVVPMEHDNCNGPNVIKVKTALHHLQKSSLDLAANDFSSRLKTLPEKKIAFILGGNTKDYEFTSSVLDQVLSAIDAVKQKGFGVLLSTARRTPDSIVNELSKHEDEQCWFYLGEGENPYLCFLSQAQGFVATSDSVSMVSEMLFTGKPVYLIDLQGFNRRLMRFKQNLIETNMVKEWQGVYEPYQYTPPDANEEVATFIKNKFASN